MAASAADDYNTGIIKEFRANRGHVGGPWAGTTLMLLHHVGARSGLERVTPLAYHAQPGGRFAIWAANGGSPAHPNWYYNLKANPRITVEVGAEAFTVLAQETIMTDMPLPPVVDRAAFEADLDALRVREKAHTGETDGPDRLRSPGGVGGLAPRMAAAPLLRAVGRRRTRLAAGKSLARGAAHRPVAATRRRTLRRPRHRGRTGR
jgi:deazaflavin-dependent oxidoreductase (nitroreductase family)